MPNKHLTPKSEKEVKKVIPFKTDPYNANLLTPPVHHGISIEKSVPMHSRPPWPEWTDDEINKETWEENESISLYEDITGHLLPPSIRPVQWVRPTYMTMNPRLIDWTEHTLDLITPNIHLCELSEAIRYILSEISELYDYSKEHDFKCEGEDVIFTRNSIGTWNPWDHIYSLCKAGVKGEEPKYNPVGRYFVRLHYMGCWRRITVDDRIPILKSGLSGLPLGQKTEIWPLLLTKALLKIASLTSDELHGIEIKEFSSISCLTGWTHEWHDILAPITSDELWTDLIDILPKYKQPTSANTYINGVHSKKQLDDNSAYWWLPPTSLSDANAGDQQEYDDFGEPINNNASKTQPNAMNNAKETPDAERNKFKERKRKAHKSKRRTKKDSLNDSELGVTELGDDVVMSTKDQSTVQEVLPQGEVHRSGEIGTIDETLRLEEKGKGKKGKGGKKKGQDKDENENEGKGTDKKKKKGQDGNDNENENEGKGKDKKKKNMKVDENEDDGKGKDKKKRKSKDVDKKNEEKEKKNPEAGDDVEIDDGKVKDKKKKKKKSDAVELTVGDVDQISKLENGEDKNVVGPKKSKKGKKGEGENIEKKQKGETTEEEGKTEVKEKKGKEKGKKGNKEKLKKLSGQNETGEELPLPKIVENDEGLEDVKKKKLKGSKHSTDPGTDVDDSNKIGKKDKKSKKHKKKKGSGGSSIDIDGSGSLPITKDEFIQDLKEKLLKKIERMDKEKQNMDDKKSEITISIQHQKIPPMHEIIYGVQKYSGVIYHSIISTFEENSGKDLPIALTIIFRDFPKEGDQVNPAIPSFLYHPIRLCEIRDCPLAKSNERPTTPLWKLFRWKAWAMKKGIIPMEEDHFKDIIRSVKIHTPFALNTDWYNHHPTLDYNNKEIYGEDIPEDGFFEDEEYSTAEEGGTGEGRTESLENRGDGSPETIKMDKITSDTYKTHTEGSRMSLANSIFGTGNKTKSTSPSVNFDDEEIVGVQKSEVVNDIIVNKPEDKIGGGEIIFHSKYSGEMMGEERYEFMGHHNMTQIIPNNACGSLWFDVENLANNLKKFCKFYSGRSTFGSCFTLQRTPGWNFETPIIKNDDQIPTKSIEIINFHSNTHSQNLTLNFGESKRIHVMSYHLDDLDGFDSGFYIFSDSWTEQEMIFDLEVLQQSVIKKYIDNALEIDAIPTDPTVSVHDDIDLLKKLDTPKVNITVILEPWDWRNDCCIEAPVICGTTQTRWTTHVPLPPGRNTFRLWLIQDYPEISTSGFSSFQKLDVVRRVMESHKRKQITQFSLKIMSKTPIHVGSRDEIQNYLTNEPVLFLKQCEAFAHNIWILLLSFGKSPLAYNRALSSVRRTYCPTFNEPNKINKILKYVHTSFDEYFVSMIKEMNDNKMDNGMLLAIRSILLNPTVGHVYGPTSKSYPRGNPEEFDMLILRYTDEQRLDIVHFAVSYIQRYFRGWRVRRLFQVRNKGHKYFPRLEFQIRKIALVLAKHTDSSFSIEHQYNRTGGGNLDRPSSEEGGPNESDISANGIIPQSSEIPFPPKLSLTPQPPKWAVNLLRLLLERHPMLITVHPHAYCVPLHIKIKDIEGTLPSFLKDSEWLPFFRQAICIPNEPKWTYCEFDLQVHPRDGIMLKVINNETMEILSSVTNRLYLGRLPVNKLGYTIICYRWANSSETRPDAYQRSPSKKWKLRIISPQIQKSILLRDITHMDEEETPKKLSLYRFTGYYIPNGELCICRYTVETRQFITYLSIRFKASNPKAQLNLQIIDLNQNKFIFEYSAIGGFLIPSIRIEGKRLEPEEIRNTTSFKVINNNEGSSGRINSKLLISSVGDKEESYISLDHSTSSEQEINLSPPNRYLISIFTKQNSWKLNDDDWIFIQHEKKNFWKRLIANKKAPKMPIGVTLRRLKRQQEQEQQHGLIMRQQEEMRAESSVPTPSGFDITSHDDKINNTSSNSKGKASFKKKVKGKDTTGKNKSNFGKEKSTLSASTTNSQPKKNIGGKNLVVPSTFQVIPPPPPPPIEILPSLLPRPSLIPTLPIIHEIIEKVQEAIEFDEYHPDSYESSNIKIYIGGPHSIKVNDINRPNWILEIVTDRNQEIEFMSNLRLFNNKLEKLKKEWENKQDEMLDNGLITRVQCIPVPGAYMLADPFTLVQLLTNFESSLYLDETQMYKYTYGELLTPAQAKNKAQLEKIAEEEAEAQKRSADVRKTVKVKDGRKIKGTRAPPPTPLDVSQHNNNNTSIQKFITGDLFPTINAGSDFNFEQQINEYNNNNYSIFPIDLSIGSPSFLELANKLLEKDKSLSSIINETKLSSVELDGEDSMEYEQQSLHLKTKMLQFNEYIGEQDDEDEYYHQNNHYEHIIEEYYGERGSSGDNKSNISIEHKRPRTTIHSSSSSPKKIKYPRLSNDHSKGNNKLSVFRGGSTNSEKL